jgi:hypothetical protein
MPKETIHITEVDDIYRIAQVFHDHDIDICLDNKNSIVKLATDWIDWDVEPEVRRGLLFRYKYFPLKRARILIPTTGNVEYDLNGEVCPLPFNDCRFNGSILNFDFSIPIILKIPCTPIDITIELYDEQIGLYKQSWNGKFIYTN